MELRCPDCVSPEVQPDPQGAGSARRCGNCGARFHRCEAFVTVLDAEASMVDPSPAPLFSFDINLAEVKLRDGNGLLSTISPYSEADELYGLVDGAQTAEVIVTERERAAIYVFPMSQDEPDPVVAVSPGNGPTLLGCSLSLTRYEEEDPVAFTVRILENVVAEANGLAAGRAADSERLDRITGFINRPGAVNGGDLLEFVDRELRESGRQIDDAW